MPQVLLGLLFAFSGGASEDFATRRQVRQETCRAAEEAEQLVERLAGTRRNLPWSLPDAVRSASLTAFGPNATVAAILPLAEVTTSDRATLWATLLVPRDGGGTEPIVWSLSFHRTASGWSPDPPATFAPETDTLGPRAKLVRWSGLPLNQFPAYLRAVLREQRERYAEARAAGDGRLCAAILEETMVGFPLERVREVFADLRERPRPVDLVRVRIQKVESDRASLEIEALEAGTWKKDTLGLRRQGEGWVIAETSSSAQRKTMTSVRALATAIEAYAVDNNRYPDAASLEDLRGLLVPTYIARIPATDAWGKSWEYKVLKGGESYRIRSAGSDGAFQPEGSWRPGPTGDSRDDLVYEDGAFVTWWDETNGGRENSPPS